MPGELVVRRDGPSGRLTQEEEEEENICYHLSVIKHNWSLIRDYTTGPKQSY
jgi:hypothetical protein